jgi:hypothetical protein
MLPAGDLGESQSQKVQLEFESGGGMATKSYSGAVVEGIEQVVLPCVYAVKAGGEPGAKRGVENFVEQ